MQKQIQAQVKGDFKRIPLQLIKSSAQPSREVFEDIASLAATIKEHGLIEPIVVRKLKNGYGFEVVCGERRLRACQKAELDFVSCIVKDDITEEQALEWQLIENLQRKDLKAFEELRLVKRLKEECSLSNQEIGVKIGLSDSRVADYLLVAEAFPEELMRLITRTRGGHAYKKELTLSKAVVLARAGLTPDKLKEMVEFIRKYGLTREKLAERLAGSHKSKIKRVMSATLEFESPSTVGYDVVRIKIVMLNQMCDPKMSERMSSDTFI